METLEPNVRIALPEECCQKYSGMAFDGQFFFLTLPQKKQVYQFSREFVPESHYETSRPYTAICYDQSENCFWAAEDRKNDVLYKLNSCFEEIGYIEIRGCNKTCCDIAGLSYHCETDRILVAFADFIAELSKKGQIVRGIQKIHTGCYTAVLSVPSYLITVQRREEISNINLFSCNGYLIKSFCVAGNDRIEAIELGFCPKCAEDSVELIILAHKPGTESCLFQYSLEHCGINLCREYDTSCCNPCDCKSKWDCEAKEECPHMYECEHKCEPNPKKCTNDLIESIALVETALAHILNAEGEKLQKAVKIADNVYELLEIDRAVNRTVGNITHLEFILLSKLQEACGPCSKASGKKIQKK